MPRADYDVTIGIEIHACLNTKTKLFCRCLNDAFQKEPNETACPICMGFPGMLPVLNKQAVSKAIQTALALNLEIPNFTKWDRKNYFYPDLPMGYQISQYKEPISENGWIDVFVNGEKKRIGITRLHVENDAGKLTHTSEGTLLDYNRSGAPLVEIVSEPDITSAEEARAYAQTIQQTLRYVGTSEADMEKGHLRFDVNLSLKKKGQTEFGTRTETKNLNSFRSLERAIEAEILRQVEVLDNGGEIDQETRSWDDDKGVGKTLRSKEEAHDYRYFPEPDIPPLEPEEKLVQELKASLPELPSAKYERLKSTYDLDEEDTKWLVSKPALADFFEDVAKTSNDPKAANRWILNEYKSSAPKDAPDILDSKLTPALVTGLIKEIKNGTISGKTGKDVYTEMIKTGKDASSIIEDKGLKQISDTGALKTIIQSILDANPEIVEQIQAGKDKAKGFIVGQVMKETKGQANPATVNQVLSELLTK